MSGQKWGHSASAAAIWRLASWRGLLARASVEPSTLEAPRVVKHSLSHNRHRTYRELSIALQKEIHAEQIKREQTTLIIAIDLVQSGEYYKGYGEAQGQLRTNTVKIHFWSRKLEAV
jgi:hypothetical protein